MRKVEGPLWFAQVGNHCFSAEGFSVVFRYLYISPCARTGLSIPPEFNRRLLVYEWARTIFGTGWGFMWP